MSAVVATAGARPSIPARASAFALTSCAVRTALGMSPPWNAAVAAVQASVTDSRSAWAAASLASSMPFGSVLAAASVGTLAVIAWTRPGRLADTSFQAATWAFFSRRGRGRRPGSSRAAPARPSGRRCSGPRRTRPGPPARRRSRARARSGAYLSSSGLAAASAWSAACRAASGRALVAGDGEEGEGRDGERGDPLHGFLLSMRRTSAARARRTSTRFASRMSFHRGRGLRASRVMSRKPGPGPPQVPPGHRVAARRLEERPRDDLRGVAQEGHRAVVGGGVGGDRPRSRRPDERPDDGASRARRGRGRSTTRPPGRGRPTTRRSPASRCPPSGARPRSRRGRAGRPPARSPPSRSTRR